MPRHRQLAADRILVGTQPRRGRRGRQRRHLVLRDIRDPRHLAQTVGPGYLALFKNGIPWPGNSSINWDHADQNVANMAVVAVDANAKILVHCLGQTDFVVDVIGYYQ